MECPHCGAANKPNSLFCGECGEFLETPKGITCAMCDTPHAPGITTCTQCGARLIPPGISPAELRLELGDEAAVTDEVEGVVPEDAAVAQEPGEETVPPWLKKLETVSAEEVAEQGLEGEDVERGDLPEWLEVPPDFEDMLSEASIAVDEEEAAPAEEIPSWLEALRPEELQGVEDISAAAGPAEATGLLKGIRGTLGIEPILALPRRAVPVQAVSPSSGAYERAELFDSVVREPARPGIELAQRRRVEKLAASTVRWMTYLIVAAAVVVPLLLGSNWSEANMSVSAGATAMYDTVEALPPGALVLVSHDYDPGIAGEMIPQARAVLNHLMGRGVRLISVSLTPEGARLSRQVLDEVAEAHDYSYGEDYLSLGYVVAVEAGPRFVFEGLVTHGWSDFVGQGEEIALMVEFAGAPEYLRLWLEQVQGPYGVPMAAGVSATADPFARPYYNNEGRRQLIGLITGLVGAAEYERLSGQAGPALTAMDSQSVVHVAMVLLILVGNVAYFGGRVRGK
jgi:hypothetical protein